MFVLLLVGCDQSARVPRSPEPSPPQSTTSPTEPGSAEDIAFSYNRALNGGNCEAAGGLGGNTMGPGSSYAQWCGHTEYHPGARGIRFQINGVRERGAEAVVRFTQRMCLIGAQTGDPQTRIYSGTWTIDLKAGVIIREERKETGSHFDCEPPLLEGGS